MRIEKDTYLQNLRVAYLRPIQVPELALLHTPTEYQDFPDEFFMRIKDGRIPFGQEHGYLFLSKLGTICLFDKIFEELKDQYFASIEEIKSTLSEDCSPNIRKSYEEWLEKLGEEPEKEVYLNKILDQIDKIEKKSIKFFIKNQDKYLNKIYKKPD
jgi:hypothetical protein